MKKIKINSNPFIPNISDFTNKTKIDVRYVVIQPYVSIHIYWKKEFSELVYEVEEPLLSEKEKDVLIKIEETLRDTINFNLDETSESKEKLIEYINQNTQLTLSELGFNIEEESYQKIFYYIYRNFFGLNEIEPLMKDYFIEDIECNGINEPIYIVHRVFRNLKTNIKFTNVETLASFVEKLAQKTGRYISYATPILDGSLPDGSRVNATYTKDISSKGPTFTIRKFTKIPWTPTQLVGFNSLSPEILAYFWILLENKSNLMIVGGTASGKTTLLNALSFFIPSEDRVVSIEDTRELNLPRENWLPSVVRSGVGSKSSNDINMFSLLKSSFRQNPDYVIVGEVRGQEASVLFQGMASGHASISTLHANSVQTVIQRLETPPINLSPTLINGLDALAVQTHAIVGGKETRRLREVTEVINVNPDDTFNTNTPFMWDHSSDKFLFISRSIAFDNISKKQGIPREELGKEFRLRTLLLYKLVELKVFGYDEIQKVINEYSKNPQGVLGKYNILDINEPQKDKDLFSKYGLR